MMNVRPLVPLLILILCCGASAPASVATEPTLEGDPRLPAAQIATYCRPEQWEVLRGLKYRALVILNTQIQLNGSMTGGSVRVSEPDSTWVIPARELTKKVRVQASSTGTHMLAAGEVFVIFYGEGPGRKALVFARLRGDTLPEGASKTRYFAIESY